MKRPLPLAPRLALAFALPAAAAVLACGVFAYTQTRDALEDELSARLCALATVAAQAVPRDLALALEPGDEETRTAQNLRRRLNIDPARRSVSRVLLLEHPFLVRLDTSGVLPIGAVAHTLQVDAPLLDPARLAGGEPQESVRFRTPDGRSWQRCYASVPGDGPSLLVAVEGASDLFGVVERTRWMFGGLLLLAVLLVVLVAALVGRQLSRPLLRLSQEASAMGDGNLARSITVGPMDEVGQVAHALDEMRKRLQARDEEQQMMLAGIAHEVRNPLGGMELYAGLLADTVGDLPDTTPPHLRAEMVDAVGRIRRELGHLSGVVHDFLNFAREVPPQRRAIHPSKLLAEVVQLVQPDAAGRNVVLRALPVDEALVVELDEGMVRRALLNLTQNAVQACPAGAVVELDASVQGGVVSLTVRDNGPGMTPDALAKALTPFFTTKEKGTGLGLPLVVKTARAHGGRLQVETAEGKGFCASLVMPASGPSLLTPV